jgi:hypothetical protein
MSTISNIKFIGIKIDDTHLWKSHIDMIVPKVIAACFAIRMVKPCMPLEKKNNLLCIFSLHHELWNNLRVNSLCCNTV